MYVYVCVCVKRACLDEYGLSVSGALPHTRF